MQSSLGREISCRNGSDGIILAQAHWGDTRLKGARPEIARWRHGIKISNPHGPPLAVDQADSVPNDWRPLPSDGYSLSWVRPPSRVSSKKAAAVVARPESEADVL